MIVSSTHALQSSMCNNSKPHKENKESQKGKKETIKETKEMSSRVTKDTPHTTTTNALSSNVKEMTVKGPKVAKTS